ncbi:MAG: hypothetical protein E4G97_01035 [Deltaproteobacteria bacterium]|nr:MAG: hypothetical protein E4G97_01035 [Deltaproteobacteria bacterium]
MEGTADSGRRTRCGRCGEDPRLFLLLPASGERERGRGCATGTDAGGSGNTGWRSRAVAGGTGSSGRR